MSNRKWALLGNWSFIAGTPKGLSVYSYDAETGNLTLQETILPELCAGQQHFDHERSVDYVVNEIGHRKGELGGGGYIMALKVNRETGKVELINEKESLAPEPSYCCLDKSGKYLIVVHHVDSGHVTKIRKENGKYISETLFDDAAIVLFPVYEDGSLGDPCDVHIIKGIGYDLPYAIPHLHSVVPNPTGELYIICDKGTDRIYSFKIDTENGKLIHVSTTGTEVGTSPRYLTFHPTLPILYVNYEKTTKVSAYKYSVDEGITELLDDTRLLMDEKSAEGIERVEASDILITKDASRLYVCIRGVNLISVMTVDEKGALKVVQNVACSGDPRGLTLAPDGRFLFSCNMLAGTVSTFTVDTDGMLTFRDNSVKGVSPANMIII